MPVLSDLATKLFHANHIKSEEHQASMLNNELLINHKLLTPHYGDVLVPGFPGFSLKAQSTPMVFSFLSLPAFCRYSTSAPN